MERLLKEYRQNQELVRRIGGHYYQIIYPVQLRHHEKMGISTREVAKVRNRIRKRNTFNSTVCSIISLIITSTQAYNTIQRFKLYFCFEHFIRMKQTTTKSVASSAFSSFWLSPAANEWNVIIFIFLLWNDFVFFIIPLTIRWVAHSFLIIVTRFPKSTFIDSI